MPFIADQKDRWWGQNLYIEYFGGAAPVQAWGTIRGYQFYFRSRHEHWSFAVALTPDIDPADICFPDQGFYREELYDGKSNSASYMPEDEAEAIIQHCAAAFIQRVSASNG